MQMQLNDDDIALVYARACRSWYGTKAAKIINAQIGKLRRAGDRNGVAAWARVASKLSDVRKQPRNKSGKLY